jgi:hypothetical protein
MPPAKKKAASTPKVDETVVNQEHPISSEEDRKPEDSKPDEPQVAKMAPANPVDVTVVNQESLGAGEVVDRSEPVIHEDANGNKYDVSKPYPELLTADSDPEEQKRKNRLRQESGVLDAKEIEGENDEEAKKNQDPDINIEFLETGLTAERRVWKAGEILTLKDNEETRRASADNEDKVWYEQSASEQKERYGKVFFEKR